jgi:hypothetical protein
MRARLIVGGSIMLAALMGALVPIVSVMQSAGPQWQGIMPELVTDSLYYHAQMREVFDGYPKVGNPYTYEHRTETAPAFFIPVIISALPLFVGIPLAWAVTLNLFVWLGLFLTLAYLLSRSLGLARWWALSAALFMALCGMMFIVRPVALQIVFPVFLWWMYTLSRWLHEPTRGTTVHFIVATVVVPYAYTYLAYIVLPALGVLGLMLVVYRRESIVQLMKYGLVGLIAVIPFVLFVMRQLHHPWYMETLERIGLVATRIPAIEFLWYGRWVIIGSLGLLMADRMLSWRSVKSPPPVLVWTVVVGSGLLIGAWFNLIIGTELTIAIHVGRFIVVWTALVLVLILARMWHSGIPSGVVQWIRTLVALMCVVLLLMGSLRTMYRSFAFLRPDTVAEALQVQAYAQPLSWLAANAPRESVVWSNDAFAEFVPIYTSHYVLFAPASVLQVVSSVEVEDRYLLSRMHEVTIDSLKRDLLLYAGAGKAKEQPLNHNRHAFVCMLAQRVFSSTGECVASSDAVTLAGKAYFERLQERSVILNAARDHLLTKYRVRYLVIDTRTDPVDFIPASAQVRFTNERFVIYELPFSDFDAVNEAATASPIPRI